MKRYGTQITDEVLAPNKRLHLDNTLDLENICCSFPDIWTELIAWIPNSTLHYLSITSTTFTKLIWSTIPSLELEFGHYNQVNLQKRLQNSTKPLLSLFINCLTTSDLETISTLTSLTNLTLSSSQSISSSVFLLTNLTNLSLSGSCLDDRTLQLNSLQKLSSLSLDGSIWTHIPSSLTELSILTNDLDPLKHLTCLKTLTISECDLIGDQFSTLLSLTQLTNLNIDSDIENINSINLTSFVNLKTLALHPIRAKDKTIEQLTHLTNLTHLHLVLGTFFFFFLTQGRTRCDVCWNEFNWINSNSQDVEIVRGLCCFYQTSIILQSYIPRAPSRRREIWPDRKI